MQFSLYQRRHWGVDANGLWTDRTCWGSLSSYAQHTGWPKPSPRLGSMSLLHRRHTTRTIRAPIFSPTRITRPSRTTLFLLFRVSRQISSPSVKISTILESPNSYGRDGQADGMGPHTLRRHVGKLHCEWQPADLSRLGVRLYVRH